MLQAEKKIVIQLPKLNWRWLLAGGACLAVFVYWHQLVRPYLTVEEGRVETFSLAVSSDIGAKLVEMHVQEGEKVQKGQTLFSLDAERLIAKRKMLKTSLLSMAQQMQLEKDRMEKAMEEYVSLSEKADPDVRRPLSILEEAQGKSESLAPQMAMMEAELELLDAEEKKMTLKAPFDGVVLEKRKEIGAMTAFAETVYVISDPGRMWVSAHVVEKEMGLVTVGTEAEVQMAAYPGRQWKGKVCWMGPALIGGKVPIRIALEETADLRPGLSAQVTLKVRP